MVMMSSRRPVARVIDLLRSTSRSRLIPSGVTSYAQAMTSAAQNPTAMKKNNAWMTQAGAPMFSSTRSATCATTHAATT